MSFCRTCTLPPYWQGAKDREWKKYPVSIYVILVEKRKYRLLTDGRCVVARTGRAVDHHLTTLPLGSSPRGNFHVPTSFSLRNNQCRNLCTLHKSLRWFIAICQMSQFSDSKGQRFESPRPHQKRSLYCITVTFFIFLGSVLVNPFLTLRSNIGHGTHEKADKIAHEISLPC